jgi:glyoxylase I family protein
MFKIETFHHVSIPVTNMERSKVFYKEILGLQEIKAPIFDFPVAWLQMGDKQLHLIQADTQSTLREGKEVVPQDIHFAIRVNSYQETREFLRSEGYYPDAPGDLMKTKESPASQAGFPQLYIMDPDRNIIELNAENWMKFK